MTATNRNTFICSNAITPNPAITAALTNITNVLRHDSFHTFHTGISVLIATITATQSEFTMNCDRAVIARSETNCALPVSLTIFSAGPTARLTASDAANTEKAAIAIFMRVVLTLMGTPLLRKFQELNVISSAARRTATGPPYRNIERKIKASEVVTYIFVRGSWNRRFELRKTVTKATPIRPTPIFSNGNRTIAQVVAATPQGKRRHRYKLVNFSLRSIRMMRDK